MKKLFLVILILLGALFFKIPEYRELNDIAIIEGIAVEYNGYSYTLHLKEVIPIKSEKGVEYEYKYYKGQSSSIRKCYEEITSNTKKKLYLKRCKFLVTNLYSSNKIIDFFNIEPVTIYHEIDNVQKKLKEL